MTRITKYLRDKIVTNAIEKSGINTTIKTIETSMVKLGEDIRIDYFDGIEQYEKYQEIVKNSNRKLKFYNSNYQFNAAFGGQRYCFSLGEYKATPHDLLTFNSDHEFSKRFFNLERQLREAKDKRDEIETTVKGSISKFTTVEKLLKVWSEAKELIPETVKPQTTEIVLVTDDLNKMIGLPTNESQQTS